MSVDNNTVFFDYNEDENWRENARCRGYDPSYFHPERGQDTTEIKKCCFLCPVKADCLIEALEWAGSLGIWGMTSERQRRKMRREIAALGIPARKYVFSLPGYGVPPLKKEKE